MLLVLGLGFEGVNAVLLASQKTIYPMMLMAGTVLIPYGLWTLVTGIAYDRHSKVKPPPTWWTVSAVMISIGGLAIGGALTFWLDAKLS